MCCSRCWAEALCTSSLYHPKTGVCLLQTDPATEADTTAPPDDLVGWTHCKTRRSGPALSLRIPATVPGDLITDLQRAGHIGDPLHEKTFLNSSLWTHHTWNYTAAIHATGFSEEGQQILLVFDGIKMGARIALDGHLLGTASDQFLRYVFDVTKILSEETTHTLSVAFDPAIHVDGRFSACTGGWDWAPYSHSYLDGAHTFSKGLWKSVYLATVSPASAAITHMVPQIFYRGGNPSTYHNKRLHA